MKTLATFLVTICLSVKRIRTRRQKALQPRFATRLPYRTDVFT
jgi:hypothetical protein